MRLKPDTTSVFAYANVSWSKQRTDQPTSIASTVYSFAYSDLSDLPSSYATVDVGGRLFDRKLTVGSPGEIHR